MDKVTEKKKILILFVAIIAFVALIAGGTYAWMSFTGAIVSNNGNTLATCFVIEDDYTDEDGTTSLNGTLIQSSKPKMGLSGTVGMKIRSDCGIAGVGHIYLTVNENTDSVLYKKAPARCENPTTLETMKEYTSSSTCTSNGGTWIPENTHSALKYAVYENIGDDPVSVGYIDGTGKITLHGNFELSYENKLHYIYIWLDGNLADSTYAGVSFDGYVHLGANQLEKPVGNENSDEDALVGEAIAVYSADDSYLRFYREENPSSVTVGSTYRGRTVTSVYTDFEDAYYTSFSEVPWNDAVSGNTGIVFEDYVRPKSINYWFYGTIYPEDLSKLDTSDLTSMNYVFYGTMSGLDLSSWDVSNVTDMSYMFYDQSYLTQLDISGWDTGNVTNMSYMFAGTSLQTLDLTHFDTSKVTNMEGMFSGYGDVTNNLYLDGWDTSKVTNMSYMFNNSSAYLNLNLSGLEDWDTGNVTDMSYMFYGYGSTLEDTTANLSAIEGWNTGNVTNMEGMFDGSPNIEYLDLSSWNVCKIPTRPTNFGSLNMLEPSWGMACP